MGSWNSPLQDGYFVVATLWRGRALAAGEGRLRIKIKIKIKIEIEIERTDSI